jgi:hypothetical protein
MSVKSSFADGGCTCGSVRFHLSAHSTYGTFSLPAPYLQRFKATVGYPAARCRLWPSTTKRPTDGQRKVSKSER